MAAPAILAVPRVTPRIDLGVGDSRDATGLGQWQPDGGNAANTRWVAAGATTGSSTWNGEEPHWVDITCYGREITTYVGHERATDQWEVGTATIVLDNQSGWADFPPTVAPNPFSLTVRPGRQVRVAVTVDGSEPQVLWRGWVDQANPNFDAEAGDLVTLECIDAKGEIGHVDIPAVDPPVGAGESIPARLHRIADGAGWAELLAQLRRQQPHRRRHRAWRPGSRPAEPGRRLWRRRCVRRHRWEAALPEPGLAAMAC